MTTVLGINFQSEDERRQFFREELRKKLPELRRIEGFPIGTEADILALSDPPFYTACPNPWLNDFIKEWETAKQFPPFGGQGGLRTEGVEVSEPYAADVSEGKNNPIYNAHSYHTKVPHPAIMRYILHYTQPGDIVFDGFAGTGMTGVAAQLCANPDPTTKHVIEKEFKNQFGTKPVWGVRRAILGDLSPVASFIAYNYNAPVDVEQFDAEARRILKEVEAECGWMYQTKHADGKMGTINYTVWSDVFACGNCGEELVFWNEAVNIEKKKLLDEFPCRQCQALQNKKNMEKVSVSYFDKAIGETIRQTKTKPVLIYYTFNKKRFEKKPDAFDLELIEKIENTEGEDWFPTDRMPEGDESRRNDRSGVTHVHQFFTKRNLLVLSCFWSKSEKLSTFKWIISGVLQRANRQHQIAISRVGGDKANAGGNGGTRR